jgi:phenylpropionate dioxygenase-like ring-hydroxylating dioxygenase large terminal subunit
MLASNGNFLKDCWYVAAMSQEVSTKPLGRTLLERAVVLFRTEEGAVVALNDRCPHRFVPLSLGKVIGSSIQCTYHGLRFGPNGSCIHNPHGKVAQRLRIDAYPTIERYGYIWIWFGDPSKSDPSTLPNMPLLEREEEFTFVRGVLSVNANYELVTDNLLDLSHIEYLHPALARAEGVEGQKVEFFRENDTVIANRWKPNNSLSTFARLFWDCPPSSGDGRANIRWQPPAFLYLDIGVTEVGGKVEEGVCTPSIHLLTPATPFRTHYFWAQGRNRRLNDSEFDRKLWEMTDRIFRTEDKLVIEAQQASLGESADLLSMRPLLLEPDAPAMMARRILSQRISAEAAAESAEP